MINFSLIVDATPLNIALGIVLGFCLAYIVYLVAKLLTAAIKKIFVFLAVAILRNYYDDQEEEEEESEENRNEDTI